MAGPDIWSLDDLNNPTKIATITSPRDLARIHIPLHQNGGQLHAINHGDHTTLTTEPRLLSVIAAWQTSPISCPTCRESLYQEGGRYTRAITTRNQAAGYATRKRRNGHAWKAPTHDEHNTAVIWTNTHTTGGPDIEGAWWRTICRQPIPRTVAQTVHELDSTQTPRRRTLVMAHTLRGTVRVARRILACSEHTLRHFHASGGELWAAIIDHTHLATLAWPGDNYHTTDLGALDAATSANIARTALSHADQHIPQNHNGTGIDAALHTASAVALITHTT